MSKWEMWNIITNYSYTENSFCHNAHSSCNQSIWARTYHWLKLVKSTSKVGLHICGSLYSALVMWKILHDLVESPFLSCVKPPFSTWNTNVVFKILPFFIHLEHEKWLIRCDMMDGWLSGCTTMQFFPWVSFANQATYLN